VVGKLLFGEARVTRCQVSRVEFNASSPAKADRPTVHLRICPVFCVNDQAFFLGLLLLLRLLLGMGCKGRGHFPFKNSETTHFVTTLENKRGPDWQGCEA
jgi:hypothetical protein